MKIAVDIGGCISKYPEVFRKLFQGWGSDPSLELHIITDMHVKEYVLKQLEDNDFHVPPERVHTANYARYGELCKAYLIKKIGIDILIDDFPGYLVWDHRFGPAPIRMQIQPDPYRPYWDPSWKTEDGCDFGRRVAPPYEEIINDLINEFETERIQNVEPK